MGSFGRELTFVLQKNTGSKIPLGGEQPKRCIDLFRDHRNTRVRTNLPVSLGKSQLHPTNGVKWLYGLGGLHKHSKGSLFSSREIHYN